MSMRTAQNKNKKKQKIHSLAKITSTFEPKKKKKIFIKDRQKEKINECNRVLCICAVWRLRRLCGARRLRDLLGRKLRAAPLARRIVGATNSQSRNISLTKLLCAIAV